MGLKSGLLKADNENEIKILPVKPYCKKPAACSTGNSEKLAPMIPPFGALLFTLSTFQGTCKEARKSIH